MWEFGKIDIIILFMLDIIWSTFSNKISKIFRIVIICITCAIALFLLVASYKFMDNEMGVLSYIFMWILGIIGLFVGYIVCRCFWFKIKKLEEFDGWGDAVFMSSVWVVEIVNMLLCFS